MHAGGWPRVHGGKVQSLGFNHKLRLLAVQGFTCYVSGHRSPYHMTATNLWGSANCTFSNSFLCHRAWNTLRGKHYLPLFACMSSQMPMIGHCRCDWQWERESLPAPYCVCVCVCMGGWVGAYVCMCGSLWWTGIPSTLYIYTQFAWDFFWLKSQKAITEDEWLSK